MGSFVPSFLASPGTSCASPGAVPASKQERQGEEEKGEDKEKKEGKEEEEEEERKEGR